MNLFRRPDFLRADHARSAFTLIELLVVIAIIAILSIVVVLTLNPASLLQQSRDSNRISDLATLNTALGIYGASGGTSFGSSSMVYVSIPDPSATSTAGDQCQGLGLPTLPSLYSYHCSASSTYRNTDSTGWIPVLFSSTSGGSPLGSLPVDPINQSSSRLYYTYTTNGTQFELTSSMESQKYKLGGSNDVIGSDGATLSSVYAKGSNLSLEPLDYGDPSLVGLWSFNEGTGTIAYDYSGNNATGSWNGTLGNQWALGKIGPYAGNFDGSTNYVKIATTTTASTFTITAWVNSTAATNTAIFDNRSCGNPGCVNFNISTAGKLGVVYDFGGNVTGSSTLSNGIWNFVALSSDGNNTFLYVNGVLDKTGVQSRGSGTHAGFIGM